MQRYFSLLFLVFIGFQSDAENPIFESQAECIIDSVQENLNLGKGKSQIIVQLNALNFSDGEKILYGYDDEGLETFLNDRRTFVFELDSGEHILQFYPPEKINFAEITTRPIHFNAQTTTYLTLNFKIESHNPGVMRKPIIYLYPTEETTVSVAVKPTGDLTFTYPDYTDK